MLIIIIIMMVHLGSLRQSSSQPRNCCKISAERNADVAIQSATAGDGVGEVEETVGQCSPDNSGQMC